MTDWKIVSCAPCGGSGSKANVFLRRGIMEIGPIRPIDWVALPWWSLTRGRCTFCSGIGMRLVPT